MESHFHSPDADFMCSGRDCHTRAQLEILWDTYIQVRDNLQIPCQCVSNEVTGSTWFWRSSASKSFHEALLVGVWLLNSSLQCAMPAFEGLLPSTPHDKIVLNLLFDLACWHAYAKLQLHTDDTLDFFDSATITLGHQYVTSRGRHAHIMTHQSCLQNVCHMVTVRLLWHPNTQIPPHAKAKHLLHESQSNSIFVHINIMPSQIIQTWFKDLGQLTIILPKRCVGFCVVSCLFWNVWFVGWTWALPLKASVRMLREEEEFNGW